MTRWAPWTRISNWAPVLLYVALIFYLSSLSQVPWNAPVSDYFVHAGEYLGLAVLLARALNGGLTRVVSARLLFVAFLLCTAYAITDELHQMFVPNRFADYGDVLADSAGAAAGLLALRFCQRILLRVDAA